VDLKSAGQALSGRSPLQGSARGELSLDGAGLDWNRLRQTLTGRGAIGVSDGALATVNLDRQIADALVGALRVAGVQAPAGVAPIPSQGGTPLRDLQISFQVVDGAIQLAHPVRVSLGLGTATLGGAIGLDQQLHLSGAVALGPQTVASLTGGKWKPAQPVNLPLGIGGSLASPALQLPPPPQIAQALLAQSPAGNAVRRLGEELRRQGRQKVGRSVPAP